MATKSEKSIALPETLHESSFDKSNRLLAFGTQSMGVKVFNAISPENLDEPMFTLTVGSKAN